MNQSDKEDQKSNISFQQVSWGLVAIVAVLFVVLNSDKTEMNLIFAQPKLPLFVHRLTLLRSGGKRSAPALFFIEPPHSFHE